jgi:hypothetical protein
MSAVVRFEWTASPDELASALGGYEENLLAAVSDIVAKMEGDAESWMKANAPWNDQSGDARAGLRAIAQDSGVTFALLLMHTVYYGPYLEFGTYKMSPRPILGPAQAVFGARLMAAIHALGLH